jgi:UDP-N-acetyl-D-glucosamine dehydrogenase
MMALSLQTTQRTRAANTAAQELTERIVSRDATVAVIGLGYVGLPLAIECAQAEFPVLGLDTDASKVAHVNAGKSYIRDVSSDVLGELVSKGHMRASRQHAVLDDADVIIICVPTPITRNKEPDVSYVTQAAKAVQRHLGRGKLVIVRSTSYPGTTEELVRPILEASGLKVGYDVFLAFAPERINPGTPAFTIRNIPVVVGGCDRLSTEVAALFFRQMASKVVTVSNPAAAEMVKLLENVFRNVNIALVNQMAMLCDRMGLDIWEIVKAAATKPYGFMPFTPGLVGGHCIPVDPYFLAWKAREYDFHADFIELAARVNDDMPYFVAGKVIAALNHHQKGAEGASVLVLGVAFKKDIDDCRHSPALKVIELLATRGMRVSYHDPYAREVRFNGSQLRSVSLTDEALRQADCVVILTDHSCISYEQVVTNARLIVDSRNATRDFQASHIVRV